MPILRKNKKIIMLAIFAVIATIVVLSCLPVFADVKTSGSNNLFGWIFVSLLNFMLKGILGVVDSFRSVFESMFSPDVASKSSAFQSVFGSIGNFQAGFQAIGWSLAVLVFVIQIIKGMLGDVYRVENPWNLTIRFVLCLVMIINYSSLMSIVFDFGGGMYTTIYNQTRVVETTNDGHVSKDVNFNRNTSDGDKNVSTDFTDAGDKMSENFSDEIDKEMGDKTNPFVSMGAGILAFMLVCAIGLGYIMLMLEIIERYVLCGMLYIFAPVPIAFETSEETSQIFKNFVMMVFTTLLLTAMNLFFYNIIGRAIGTLIATKGTASGHKTVATEFITLAMIYAMIRIARNFDDYLNTMGFSTARTGQGMLGEMIAAAGTIATVATLATKGGRAVGRGTSHAADAIGRFGHEHVGPVLAGDKWEGSVFHDKAKANYESSGAYTTAGGWMNARNEAENMAAAVNQYKSGNRSYNDLKKLNDRYNRMTPKGQEYFKKHYKASSQEFEQYQRDFDEQKQQRDLKARETAARDRQSKIDRQANSYVRAVKTSEDKKNHQITNGGAAGELAERFEGLSKEAQEQVRDEHPEVWKQTEDYYNAYLADDGRTFENATAGAKNYDSDSPSPRENSSTTNNFNPNAENHEDDPNLDNSEYNGKDHQKNHDVFSR